MTGDVPVTPVIRVGGIEAVTAFSFQVDGDLEGAGAVLIAGRISLLPSTRPRPVDDLACKQVLDRVDIQFSRSGTDEYDGFEMFRDGTLVATLPRDVGKHSEPVLSLGPNRYTIVGFRGAETSLGTSCEVVVVTPAAPPPLDVRCREDGKVFWSNGAAYERIVVIRNGERVADLPGNSVSFEDGARPEGPTVYSVVG